MQSTRHDVFIKTGARTFSAVLFLMVVAVSFLSCRKTGPTMYDGPPEITIGKIYWEAPHPRPVEERATFEIKKELAVLFAMVDRKDWTGLADHVSADRGLYIDLKSHKTREQLDKELHNPEGYLQRFYFNTEALRKHTGNAEQLAVRDILRTTRTIKADFYMEPGERECELKLRLEDNPDMSYMLNNPVFIKENDLWKVYRLF
ncbi:MAG: hypothetical protein HY042_11450 [Spirochaetia bacterium]|nr:hypothetical protein [Spirochaetia bacterium]